MNRKFLVLIISIFLIHTVCYGQVNDAGLWATLNVDKKLSQKFVIKFSQEFRFNENISELGTAFSEVGVDYKLNKFFSASAGYRFIQKKIVDDSYSIRHRALFDINAKYKIKKVAVGARVRFQRQFADVLSSTKGKIPTDYLRFKLTVRPDFEKKYKPFIAGETFIHLNNPEKVLFDSYRLSAGLEYEFNKISSVNLFYLIDREINIPEPLTLYIIGVGYNHSF